MSKVMIASLVLGLVTLNIGLVIAWIGKRQGWGKLVRLVKTLKPGWVPPLRNSLKVWHCTNGRQICLGDMNHHYLSEKIRMLEQEGNTKIQTCEQACYWNLVIEKVRRLNKKYENSIDFVRLFDDLDGPVMFRVSRHNEGDLIGIRFNKQQRAYVVVLAGKFHQFFSLDAAIHHVVNGTI